MSCQNLTLYVENTNEICGTNMAVVIDTCHEICLVSIIHLLNNCLLFITGLDDVKKDLEQIITFCYNKLNPH